MKQITIYELLPLLRPGFVAMNFDGVWYYHKEQPIIGTNQTGRWINYSDTLPRKLSGIFNIAPFDGDWKDSLMECGK